MKLLSPFKKYQNNQLVDRKIANEHLAMCFKPRTSSDEESQTATPYYQNINVLFVQFLILKSSISCKNPTEKRWHSKHREYLPSL